MARMMQRSEISEFLSTPSVGRATYKPTNNNAPANISIHALRGEGDIAAHSFFAGDEPFLSTPSVGRATPAVGVAVRGVVISIHALRGEGDRITSTKSTPSRNFYPRPPWGGRLEG